MFDSHRGQKIFSLPRVVPCFPLQGLTPSGLFMGLSSTLIYTSGLILCSTICVLREVVKTTTLEQDPPNHKIDGGVCLHKRMVKCDHRSKFSNLSNWKVEA